VSCLHSNRAVIQRTLLEIYPFLRVGLYSTFPLLVFKLLLLSASSVIQTSYLFVVAILNEMLFVYLFLPLVSSPQPLLPPLGTVCCRSKVQFVFISLP